VMRISTRRPVSPMLPKRISENPWTPMKVANTLQLSLIASEHRLPPPIPLARILSHKTQTTRELRTPNQTASQSRPRWPKMIPTWFLAVLVFKMTPKRAPPMIWMMTTPLEMPHRRPLPKGQSQHTELQAASRKMTLRIRALNVMLGMVVLT
jgi:hypothetical protein